jgi:hypothetical protein
MKKSEAQALGPLIVIGVVVYLFIWLHEKVGWAGITILGGIVLGGIVYWIVRSSRKDEEKFSELVLYVLHNRMVPKEASKLNRALAKKNFPRSILIRRLQILRDSIEISLYSKKRDTAESRFAEVKASYTEIRAEHASLVTRETMAEIDRVVTEYEKQFNTSLYTNIANAHIEKAKGLKTNKSKCKYAALAMDAILEGLDNPKSERGSLESMKAEIEQYTQSLETAS